jgi:signal transduction histidine kinase
MLESRRDDLEDFLRDDPRGQKLLPYLSQLTQQLAGERERLATELEDVAQSVEHIKAIVGTQQRFAKAIGLSHHCRLSDLVDDAIRLESASMDNHHVEIVRAGQSADSVDVDKHKVLQILVNLLSNAKHAIVATGRGHGTVTMHTTVEDGTARIEVCDDGIGIADENRPKIFTYGFTTSRKGHGFGLHNSANAAKELGGTLRCHSDGPGHGATFVLELPVGACETGERDAA